MLQLREREYIQKYFLHKQCEPASNVYTHQRLSSRQMKYENRAMDIFFGEHQQQHDDLPAQKHN